MAVLSSRNWIITSEEICRFFGYESSENKRVARAVLEGLRMWHSSVQEQGRWPSLLQGGGKGRENPPSSAFFFCSGPTHTGESRSLYSVYWMLISSRSSLTTHPEIMHNSLSGHPLDQSSWHVKLTIARGMSRLANDVDCLRAVP